MECFLCGKKKPENSKEENKKGYCKNSTKHAETYKEIVKRRCLKIQFTRDIFRLYGEKWRKEKKKEKLENEN